MCGVGLLIVIVSCIHIGETGRAVDGLVEGLWSARTLGMFSRVLLEDFGFLFGALFLALPVAAECVVEEFIGGEVGLAGAGVVLDDLLQTVFIHLLTEVRLLFLCGRAGGWGGVLGSPE